MTPLHRMAVGAGVLGTGVLFGTGWLVWQALSGVEAASGERHRELLSRVFDELERPLTELVAREEARSFLEYRYFYVPEDNANPAVVQSPLSRPSEDPRIRGWWSLDPDGSFHSPATPRGNEVELAVAQGYAPRTAADTGLGALVRDLPTGGDAGDVTVEAVPSTWLLNNGARVRRYRQKQVVNTKLGNVDPWRSETQALLDPNADAARDVAVEVRPFRGLRRGDDLVLFREVVAEGEVYRQGLVLDVPRLEASLAAAVLGGSELAPYVSLGWDGTGPATGRWRAEHRFAAPFQDVVVTGGVDEVPGLADGQVASIRALAVTMVLLVVGGGWLLARTVRTELQFAQRRTDFVSAVSHELKTPLTTIRMYAEMLRDGMVPAERRAEYHGTILSESDRLGRLIANVLELGRLEKGTATPTVMVGDAAEVLREALEVVGPQASGAGFVLEVDADPDLPAVRVDRDGLVQVVVNLVDNAVKFVGDGERRVTFRLRREGPGVALAVRDRGPGVPPEHLARVFEPFWRGERELVRRTRGTGIGLTLVRGLVHGMGGTVRAGNAPGGGFEVRLLLAPG